MNKTLIKRSAWGTVGVLAVLVAVMGIIIYKKIYTTNLIGASAQKQILFIPTGSDLDDVVDILEEKNLLINEETFRWTAKQMKYDENVKPGKYLLTATIAIVIVTLLIPYTPLAGLLGFQPLPIAFLFVLAAIVGLYILCAENVKRVFYQHVHS